MVYGIQRWLMVSVWELMSTVFDGDITNMKIKRKYRNCNLMGIYGYILAHICSQIYIYN